jgi:hypothetical protein
MDRPHDPGQGQRARKLAAALFTAGTVGIGAILSFPISQFSPFRTPSQSPVPRALDAPEPLVRPFLRPLPQEGGGEVLGLAATRPGSEEAPTGPPADVPDEEEEGSDDRVAPEPTPTTGTLTLATLTKPSPPTTTKPGGDARKATKRSAGKGKSAKPAKPAKPGKRGKPAKPAKPAKPPKH